jgi:hypothetical protein
VDRSEAASLVLVDGRSRRGSDSVAAQRVLLLEYAPLLTDPSLCAAAEGGGGGLVADREEVARRLDAAPRGVLFAALQRLSTGGFLRPAAVEDGEGPLAVLVDRQGQRLLPPERR